MRENSGLTVSFKNQLESKILVNFLKDRGFQYTEAIVTGGIKNGEINIFHIEDNDIPVYLLITFNTDKMVLTDLKETVDGIFGDILDYEINKSKIYNILLHVMPEETIIVDEAIKEKPEPFMTRIQIPKNGAEQFPARKEIIAFLSEYRVPLNKQYHMYLHKSYMWMMIDHNNKTYWFETDMANTKDEETTFHYRDARPQLLEYLSEITGYHLYSEEEYDELDDKIERSVIDEKTDQAEKQLNEFIQDVVELGHELKEDIKEGAEELFIDIKENAKGLTKRTIKNIMDTDPTEVKVNIVNTVNKTKENISIFSKVLKRKIKNL